MKIFLPIENPFMKENCAVTHLDNSENICIYNTTDKSYQFMPMHSLTEKKGNLSVKLKHLGIDTMICSSIPLLALELFSIMGIKMYKAKGENVATNIEYFFNNSLPKITAINAAEEDSCTSSCSSCSSSCG